MNKKYIPGVIIVEGKHDASKISNLYHACIVITNGYDIPKEEQAFIKAVPEDAQVYILTDSDEAGESIRKRLNNIRHDAINIKINAPEYSKKKGVNECNNSDIVDALNRYSTDTYVEQDLSWINAQLYGDKNSSELRKTLFDKFKLGKPSKLSLSYRLNILGISQEEIVKEIEYAKSK